MGIPSMEKWRILCNYVYLVYNEDIKPTKKLQIK